MVFGEIRNYIRLQFIDSGGNGAGRVRRFMQLLGYLWKCNPNSCPGLHAAFGDLGSRVAATDDPSVAAAMQPSGGRVRPADSYRCTVYPLPTGTTYPHQRPSSSTCRNITSFALIFGVSVYQPACEAASPYTRRRKCLRTPDLRDYVCPYWTNSCYSIFRMPICRYPRHIEDELRHKEEFLIKQSDDL